MFSGSDSTESQNYTQWALNPSSYQNMANDEVDWAALAQQWIIMKEAGPPLPEHMSAAPPPPIISRAKKEPVAEGGEAPMDVENDEDGGSQWNEGGSSDSFTWSQSVPPPQPSGSWGWNSSWPGPPAAVPPPNSVKTPLLPTPPFNSSYNNSKEAPTENSNYGYNSVPSPGPGYWTAAGSSKVIKPHNKRYSKVNVPVSVKPAVTLDAAKRKQLPAWIREGLEKMERDKLKQMDKTREKSEKDEFEEKVKLRENAMEILKSTVKEVENKKLSSAYDDYESDESAPSPPRRSPTPLTYEEKMLKVRRTMTEILLKVTNRDIQNICREELQRHVRKLKASDQRVSAPSGANLSAKLGLGAYEGSGESSAESGEDEPNQGYHDSDAELRDIIRRRKEEFSKTERDIEDRLANAERHDTTGRAVTPDSDSQVDAKVQDRRTRRSEDGTPPPKTNSHNSKLSRKRHSTPSSQSDSDTDKNSKSSKSKDRHSRDKRSSSSDRPKKLKRSRSRSPKLKKRKSSSRSKRSRSDSRKRDSYRAGKRRSKYTKSRSRSRSRSRSKSRSYRRRQRSRSRRRSDSRSSYKRSRSRSRSRSSRRYRRSRSYSNGRGKRSHRH